jgi:hypothetical protein
MRSKHICGQDFWPLGQRQDGTTMHYIYVTTIATTALFW